MAMFVNQSAHFSVYKIFGAYPEWRMLLSESLSGFVDGRLPGNLGDTPEVLDTGERIG